MAKAKKKTVKKLDKIVDQVLALEERYAALDDAELAALTATLRDRLEAGQDLADVQADAFAGVREAARRELGMPPYRVQVYAAAVLHDGAVAEMRTGEGKTLTATMPVYLNALAGPVDVVTANPYLAKRDAAWMGRVYRRLGMRCAPVLAGMPRPVKKAAYSCDVIYSTANELGFDYLRDRIAPSRAVQVCTSRARTFVLIDEADQVLIDEARTPLIISGLAQPPSQLLARVDQVVSQLHAGVKDSETGAETGDFIADRSDNSVFLTEAGQRKVEERLDVVDVMAEPDLAYRVHAALEAHGVMVAGREYVIVDGEILIVDEATGRTMPGRRFGKGLHEALEAKHGLELRPEVRTQATISVQNFFRLYGRMSGMTGTGAEAAEEFSEIYSLPVHIIETNKPIVRVDRDDIMFLSRDAKLNAAVADIAARQRTGQPVLVGAASVQAAEELSAMLTAAGVDHELLNARNHHREADVIAQAGRPGAVTVATNMAGRGTDILLGGDPDRLVASAVDAALADADVLDDDAVPAVTAELEAQLRPAIEADVAADRARVIELGGLYVLGTERHSSRRIDNQLRGRAGRQGEPGESVFYVSLEDDLLSLFSSTPLEWAVEKLSERGKSAELAQLDEADPTASLKALPGADLPIHHPMMGKAVVGAQKRIEVLHFTGRQSVLAYDDVVSDQRTAVYDRREQILAMDDRQLVELGESRVRDAVTALTDTLCLPDVDPADWDLDLLATELGRFGLALGPLADTIRTAPGTVTGEQVAGGILTAALGRLEQRAAEFGDAWPAVVRSVVLQVLDRHWIELISDLDVIRDAIGWRSMGQRDPVTEFRYEAHHRFETFANVVRDEQGAFLLTAKVTVTPPAAAAAA